MGVGLMPLEFTDCLTDSPSFRENLHKHEKELDKTSHQIKRLIKEVKDLLQAAKRLSTAQLTLAQSLEQFDFECIGQSLTEDEVVISKSLIQFAQLIRTIEDERDRMLGRAYDQIIQPLEKFRKDHIGAVKEGKKKFDKKTAKFCQSQERYLNLSTKKQDTVLQEADASLDMAERDFCQASLEYVFLLQEVQERKKFEFVETLLGFMFGWLTFYHQGHEVHNDFKPYMSELQLRIQKTRSNFEETSKKTESLMKKMMEMRQMKQDDPGRPPYVGPTRSGYLFLMEKKAFGTTWTKQYCSYDKSTKEFKITPFNQITSKLTAPPDSMTLVSCVRRMSDTIDKRFCFDLTAEGRPGVVYTLQALSEDDRKAWMDAMDGKEPTYAQQNNIIKAEERPLDETGFSFVQRCIEVIENRGLEEQGLYRVTGVTSKVSKLLTMGLDQRKGMPLTLEDQCEWESKTITSALKTYLRNLPEPLMTHRFHNGFIAAAKQEIRHLRVNDVHTLVHRLPKQNFDMLDMVVKHLKNVALKADKNLMTVSNIAVCFGPTLLRPEEETVASIMDLKFYNVVVEILIDNYDRIFRTQPELPERRNGDFHREIRTPPPGAPSPAQQPSPPHHTTRYASTPPVTHAVIKTYYDGPLPAASVSPGASSVQSGQSQPTYGSVGRPTRAPPSPAHRAPPPAAPHSEGSLHRITQHRRYSPPPHAASQQLLRQQPVQQQSARFAPHQHHILQQFGGSVQALGLGSTELHRDTLLNSTSSSNESVSSISSRDLNPPCSYPNSQQNHHGSPVKTRRLIQPHNNTGGVYYASSYRPQHNMVQSTAGQTPQQQSRSVSPSCGPRRVRTLYACLGENDGELSFEPNQIITNVKSSAEPGWLEGTLNGKTGLIPENYVEALP